MQRFKGKIITYNAVEKLLTVNDPLTDFTVVLTVDDNTVLTVKRQIELEDILPMQPLKCYGNIDHITHSIHLISIDIKTFFTDRYELTWNNKDFIYASLKPNSTPTNSQNSCLIGLENHITYCLMSDGQIYNVTVDNNEIYQRPNIYTYEKCECEALVLGQEIIVDYSEHDGSNNLIGAEIHNFFPAVFPYYINKPGGASDITSDDIRSYTNCIKQAYERVRERLDFLTPISMQVTPALVDIGEHVIAFIEVMSDRLPSNKLVVRHNYLSKQDETVMELQIEWKIVGKRHDVPCYYGEISLPCQKVGQYLVHYISDVGGDIKEFYRSYSVVDSSYAICLFHVLSGNPPPQEQLHQLHIPFDEWHSEQFDYQRWSNEKRPEAWANVSRGHRQYGDNPTFLLDYAKAGMPFQVREDSDEVQSAALSALKELTPLFKFQTRRDEFGHYTVGTKTIGLAKKQGYHTLTSLCTESHIDGHWAINHYGKPERPYFVGDDDFRKTGKGGKNGMVGFSQTQRHTYLARGYFCDFNPEPGNGGLLFGAGGRYCYDEIYLSRLLDFYDAMFQNSESQSVPYVIQLGLEFGGYRPGAAEGNAMMTQYAVKKAQSQNVVFSTINAVSEYYRRHYSETPETFCYLTDFWAGFTMMGKPYLCPDVISFENQRFMSLHLYGNITPDYLYDYTKPWSYPDWGNEGIPRKRDEFGYMEPSRHDKYAVTPKIEDTRGITVDRSDSYYDGIFTIMLTINTDYGWENLPLALWDIPIMWDKVNSYTLSGGNVRLVGICAPYTKNVNGMLICNLPKGKSVLTITFVSERREPNKMDFCIDDNILGKMFERDGQCMLYLWNKRPNSAEFTLKILENQHVDVYLTPKGVRQVCASGEHTFTMLQGEWARVVCKEKWTGDFPFKFV